MDYDAENPGYQSPAVTGEPHQNVSSVDEETLPTLKIVQLELAKALSEIDGIHVFDLTEKKGLTVKQQIAAYRKARDIIEPLVIRVDSVIAEINLKHKG